MRNPNCTFLYHRKKYSLLHSHEILSEDEYIQIFCLPILSNSYCSIPMDQIVDYADSDEDEHSEKTKENIMEADPTFMEQAEEFERGLI